MTYSSKYDCLQTLKKLRDVVGLKLGGPTSGRFELILKSLLVGVVPASVLFFIPLWIKALPISGWLFAGLAILVAVILGVWHWRHNWPTVRAEEYTGSRALDSDWIHLWFDDRHPQFLVQEISFCARWKTSPEWKIISREAGKEEANETLWLRFSGVQVWPMPQCASNNYLHTHGLKVLVQGGEDMFFWCRDKDEHLALLDVFRAGGCEVIPSS